MKKKSMIGFSIIFPKVERNTTVKERNKTDLLYCHFSQRIKTPCNYFSFVIE